MWHLSIFKWLIACTLILKTDFMGELERHAATEFFSYD